MKNLLAFEFFKMRKRKSMYICTATMIGVMIINVLMNYALYRLTGGFGITNTVTSNMLYATNYSNFTLIAGVFIAIYVCEDYGQKTIKNVYSRGFSRAGVYFSKLIVCAAYVVASFAVTVIFSLLFGGALFGFDFEGEHTFALLVGQLLVCIASAAFVFSVSFMVRRLGVAISLVIFVPLAVTLLLGLADILLKSEKVFLVEFWFDGMLASLSNSFLTAKEIALRCIAPVIYTALFVTVGFFVHRNAEV